MSTMMVHNIKPHPCKTCETDKHLQVHHKNGLCKVHCSGCDGVGNSHRNSGEAVAAWNIKMGM